MATLKQKLSKAESQSELLTSKVNLLQGELRKYDKDKSFSDDDVRAAIPDTYYKQKIKMLEEEVEELKMTITSTQGAAGAGKLSELAVRRAVRMGRSKSLESYEQKVADAGTTSDLRRQLTMAQQECVKLRRKTDDLEEENLRWETIFLICYADLVDTYCYCCMEI